MLLLPLSERVAQAAGKNDPPDVATAEKLYVDLDYEGANKEADRVVKQRGIGHDQLLRAYRVLAITYATMNQDRAARDAFIMLLASDPDFIVDPTLGPKILAPFQEARGFWRAQSSRPGIEVTADVRAATGGVLRVATRDPTHVTSRIVVAYRWGGNGPFSVNQALPNDMVAVEVHSAPSGTVRLDYYAQGLDARDAVVFETGNSVLPKTALLPKDLSDADGLGLAKSRPESAAARPGERPTSLFAKPLFWTVALVAVASVAVGSVLLVRAGNHDPTQANLVPRVTCGGQLCR